MNSEAPEDLEQYSMGYDEPVSRLLTAGDYGGMRSWPDYLALGLSAEHVPELIRMVQDGDLNQADSESPEVWAPVHAWRALGQLHAEAAIEPLVDLLERLDEQYESWIADEIPQVLGMIGSAALPRLSERLFAPHTDTWAQSTMGDALAEIGKRHPEVREECVATLSRALENFGSQARVLNACLIADLTQLEAVEAAPLMEKAFAADRVDISLMGDWEDVQIELGLLDERLTPTPQYIQLPGVSDLEWGQVAPPTRAQTWKEERRAERRLRDKRKAKRKQQKQARRKQRKR